MIMRPGQQLLLPANPLFIWGSLIAGLLVNMLPLGRTPWMPDALALVLVLFVTAFGVAVGVRDAGHIGLESMVSLLPEAWQHRIEVLIHVLVGSFGALMVYGGWIWMVAKWDEKKPMLPITDGIDYLPVVIAGALIVLFSIEHIIALARGTVVEPAWN